MYVLYTHTIYIYIYIYIYIKHKGDFSFFHSIVYVHPPHTYSQAREC